MLSDYTESIHTLIPIWQIELVLYFFDTLIERFRYDTACFWSAFVQKRLQLFKNMF